MHAWFEWEEYVWIFVLSDCTHTACVLTQVTKQLHSQRCKDKEEKHEEKTQIPHLQRDNRGWEGFSQRISAHTKKNWKKRMEIDVLCSKSMQQKMYGRYGLAPAQRNFVHTTLRFSQNDSNRSKACWDAFFLPVQTEPCSTLPTPQFPIHPPSFKTNTGLP